jgi:hypothetical protein
MIGELALISCLVFLPPPPCSAQFFNGFPSTTLVRTATNIKNGDTAPKANSDVIKAALTRIQRINDDTAGSPRGSGVRPSPENRPSFIRNNPASRVDEPAPRTNPTHRQSNDPAPRDESQYPVSSGKQRNPEYSSRGGARTFNPIENPLGEGSRPRIQPLAEESRLPDNRGQISQDFLPSCPDATFSYIIPSPTQCDLYYQCEFGTPSRKLCEDGQVFSISDVKCVGSSRVDCQDRPRLQPPQGTGACQRKNGIFYTNDTCIEFVTCRDNHAFFERCAPGLVFDPVQKICAWADEALRPGCLPEDLLGFRCPNPKLTQEQALLSRVHLRFGDHDRFSDPKDCRFFFMCLRTGQPRRAGCPQGKVFDGGSGSCKLAKDVPECSSYYGEPAKSSAASRAQASHLQNIEDDIQKQFNDERLRLRQLRVKRWIMEEEAFPE